jgi:recombination protein RecA
VQKSGSFFSYGDERLGQGRHNVKGYLRENPQVAQEIERKIYDALGVEPAAALGVVETPPAADAAETEAPAGAADTAIPEEQAA